jgi:LPXTG-motif cell wall-anchored protein
VFTGNGQAQGRIGGPWIENGTGCTTPPDTTVPPPTTVPPVTSTPPPATPPTGTPPAAVTPPLDTSRVARSLPATGRESTQLLVVAGFIFVVAFTLLVASVTRRGVS